MPRALYSGNERKLLLAFDVGTTFSGISYSILDPGTEPEIRGVTKFPGQVNAGADAKVPSVLYYEKDGKVSRAGAEAGRDDIDVVAEENDWARVEWFKLHLRPSTKDFVEGTKEIPPLPLDKSASDVLSDFLRYLNDSARRYIEENHPGIGSSLWSSAKIHYVLSHPNGWEGPQQSLMRQAAQNAGLITPGGGNEVTFITEGEASLNRCIEKGLMTDAIKNGEGVTIVDAGGGTIDISAYACRAGGKEFQEIAESQCHLKGSIYVTRCAVKHIEDLLRGSTFYQDIPEIERYFDKNTKCAFRNPGDPHFIRFGSPRNRDQKLKITGGRLRLEGPTVASFFEPAIQCIVNGVLAQKHIAHKPISNVFLVGGFAANDYLFERVREDLGHHGLHVYRPDAQVNKVVADGAISAILDEPVRIRVSRFSYGLEVKRSYDPRDPEHVKREFRRYEDCKGISVIDGIFSQILPRNTQVSEAQEFRSAYVSDSTNKPTLRNLEHRIMCYRGNSGSRWMDVDKENYHSACTIKARLAGVPIPSYSGPKGTYYKVSVDVVLLFGTTELKAQIAWKNNGKEYRGPAEIIYETED